MRIFRRIMPSYPALRVSTLARAAGLILLLGSRSWGKTYELRYGFRPGDSFEVLVAFSAEGTIASSAGKVPISLHGQVLRRYRVTRMEAGRAAILEPALDSASFDIAAGTSSLRVFLTPDFMELNGDVVWKKELEPANPQLIPFLRPSEFRLDPLGRRLGHPAQTHEIQVPRVRVAKGVHHVGSRVAALFAGEREVFPPLPEREVQEGDSWSARVRLGQAPGGTAGLIREGTYAIAGPHGTEGTAVEIRASERVTANGQLALLVDHLLQRGQAAQLDPTPTPQTVERERLRFEQLERVLEGKYIFDPGRGRPLSAELAGTEQIKATTVRRYMELTDAFPLSYSFDLTFRIRFEYPDHPGE